MVDGEQNRGHSSQAVPTAYAIASAVVQVSCADVFCLAITEGSGHTEQQERTWPTQGWPWASARFLTAGDGGGASGGPFHRLSCSFLPQDPICGELHYQ